jgi:L-amino acid N-acyltransferase YncA
MKILVRPADYGSESQEVVSVLQANLPHLPHAQMFQWLYHANPEGRALAWVAVHPESGRIVGVAAAFPRRIFSAGQELRGYVLGDFCIDAAQRSLGLAVSLQRACLHDLAAGDADFAFDFPSSNMLAVYKRIGIAANATVIRFAKPLRADRKLEQRVPVRVVARGLGALANAGLRLMDLANGREGDWKIAMETGPWGQEFTEAAGNWSEGMGTCVARTAEFLNWRYGEHPLEKYAMLTARKNGKLCGYLVYRTGDETSSVVDLLAESEAAGSSLLGAATALAREQGMQTLNAAWVPAHRSSRLLQRHGFRPRESCPVVILRMRGDTPVGDADGLWFLTDGDRES